jgi:methyl halide transferase
MNDKNVSDPDQFDVNFWNEKYLSGDTRWDLGECSPPLKTYIDRLTNKEWSILIPGAGNAYEASYLNQLGFKSVTIVDIAPAIIAVLRNQFENDPNIHILENDFFDHQGTYDLILEQTFFCALLPERRNKYVQKMAELLKDGGKIAGVLFNKEFNQPHPPFGGNEKECRLLFSPLFEILSLGLCYNSHPARTGNEFFFTMIKK